MLKPLVVESGAGVEIRDGGAQSYRRRYQAARKPTLLKLFAFTVVNNNNNNNNNVFVSPYKRVFIMVVNGNL